MTATRTLNDTLIISTALELLTSRIDTEVELFRANKDLLSEDDLDHIVKCCRFITEHGKSDYTSVRVEIEMHLEKMNHDRA